MKLILALKLALATSILLAGIVAGHAQTAAPLDYSRMGLLELSTRANKGDQNAAAALKKRLNSDAYQPKPKKNATIVHDPNAPVLGTSKGLGALVTKPKPTKSSSRSYDEMQKELDELAASIRVSIAKIKAGTYGAKDKKETAALLKRVKQLTAAIEIRKIADKLEYLKKSKKIIGETAKIITKSLTFVWTLKPAELKALAEKGDPKAQIELAYRYERGRKGFDKDATASFSWMLKASNSGNAHAQNFTASNYYYGKGVAKDDAKAAHWLRKSAENGNEYAQFELHNELENPDYFGWGIFDKNLKEAEYWLNKAAAQGFLVATEHKKKYHSGQ